MKPMTQQILCAAVMILGLVSCGGNHNNQSNNPEIPSENVDDTVMAVIGFESESPSFSLAEVHGQTVSITSAVINLVPAPNRNCSNSSVNAAGDGLTITFSVPVGCSKDDWKIESMEVIGNVGQTDFTYYLRPIPGYESDFELVYNSGKYTIYAKTQYAQEDSHSYGKPDRSQFVTVSSTMSNLCTYHHTLEENIDDGYVTLFVSIKNIAGIFDAATTSGPNAELSLDEVTFTEEFSDVTTHQLSRVFSVTFLDQGVSHTCEVTLDINVVASAMTP